ncbi:MAG: ribonuclease P protein component [Deferribacterales bacterium]
MSFIKEDYKKTDRIRSKKEYDNIYKTGKKLYSKFFCFFYKKGSGRIGIVVGKKVTKMAVCRNLIKRRVRHIFRTNKSLFSGLDIVLVALPSSLNASYKELVDDIKYIFEKNIDKTD